MLRFIDGRLKHREASVRGGAGISDDPKAGKQGPTELMPEPQNHTSVARFLRAAPFREYQPRVGHSSLDGFWGSSSERTRPLARGMGMGLMSHTPESSAHPPSTYCVPSTGLVHHCQSSP